MDMGLEAVPVAVVLQGQTNLTYLCESSSNEMSQCETDDSVWPGKEIYKYSPTVWIFAYVCYTPMVVQGVSQEMVSQTR